MAPGIGVVEIPGLPASTRRFDDLEPGEIHEQPEPTSAQAHPSMAAPTGPPRPLSAVDLHHVVQLSQTIPEVRALLEHLISNTKAAPKAAVEKQHEQRAAAEASAFLEAYQPSNMGSDAQNEPPNGHVSDTMNPAVSQLAPHASNGGLHEESTSGAESGSVQPGYIHNLQPTIRSLVRSKNDLTISNKDIIKRMSAMQDRMDALEDSAQRSAEALGQDVQTLKDKFKSLIETLDEIHRSELHSHVKTKMNARNANSQLHDVWEVLERLEAGMFPMNKVIPHIREKHGHATKATNYWSSIAFNAALAGPTSVQVQYIHQGLRDMGGQGKPRNYNNGNGPPMGPPRMPHHPLQSNADIQMMKDVFTSVQDVHSSLQQLNPKKYPLRPDNENAGRRFLGGPKEDRGKHYNGGGHENGRATNDNRRHSDVITSKKSTPFDNVPHRPFPPDDSREHQGDHYSGSPRLPDAPRGPKEDNYGQRKRPRTPERIQNSDHWPAHKVPRCIAKDWDRPESPPY